MTEHESTPAAPSEVVRRAAAAAGADLAGGLDPGMDGDIGEDTGEESTLLFPGATPEWLALMERAREVAASGDYAEARRLMGIDDAEVEALLDAAEAGASAGGDDVGGGLSESERLARARAAVEAAEQRRRKVHELDPLPNNGYSRFPEPDWNNGEPSAEDLEGWAETLHAIADREQRRFLTDRDAIEREGAEHLRELDEYEAAVEAWFAAPERDAGYDPADIAEAVEAGGAAPSSWQRPPDAELATWAPHDLEAWLDALAEDPDVTAAEYRDAQAAVNSAILADDLDGEDLDGDGGPTDTELVAAIDRGLATGELIELTPEVLAAMAADTADVADDTGAAEAVQGTGGDIPGEELGWLRRFTQRHITGSSEQWKNYETARRVGDWDGVLDAARELPPLVAYGLPGQLRAYRRAVDELDEEQGAADHAAEDRAEELDDQDGHEFGQVIDALDPEDEADAIDEGTHPDLHEDDQLSPRELTRSFIAALDNARFAAEQRAERRQARSGSGDHDESGADRQRVEDLDAGPGATDSDPAVDSVTGGSRPPLGSPGFLDRAVTDVATDDNGWGAIREAQGGRAPFGFSTAHHGDTDGFGDRGGQFDQHIARSHDALHELAGQNDRAAGEHSARVAHWHHTGRDDETGDVHGAGWESRAGEDGSW